MFYIIDTTRFIGPCFITLVGDAATPKLVKRNKAKRFYTKQGAERTLDMLIHTGFRGRVITEQDANEMGDD